MVTTSVMPPAVAGPAEGAADPSAAPGGPAAEEIFRALPFAVMVTGGDGTILRVNPAAEQFLGRGAAHLVGRALDAAFPPDSPVFSLLAQVAASGSGVTEHDVSLARRAGDRHVVTLTPTGEGGGQTVISFHGQSTARQIENRMVHRSAARSVTGLAALLAHEVKNPLAGIRGAAQLLEETLDREDDRVLTRMIRDESDRICRLVDGMDLFSDGGFSRRGVNIHAVLGRIRGIAEAGFGRHVRLVESYDPSLPPVHGDADQLVRMFLNIVKNACEAAPPAGGEVRLETTYHHGARLTVVGGGGRVALPLVVSVHDNGCGIPEEVAAEVFSPFITTKRRGSGLGLALAAKVVGDHGGTIEFDSDGAGTVFRVRLPVQGGAP